MSEKIESCIDLKLTEISGYHIDIINFGYKGEL